LASENGHEQVIQLVIEKGADVNAYLKYGRMTALHLASRQGHKQVVRLLKGADVISRDGRESTALHLALNERHEQIVRLLIEKGADANDREGGVGMFPCLHDLIGSM
jgi:ankyrin repeat protein